MEKGELFCTIGGNSDCSQNTKCTFIRRENKPGIACGRRLEATVESSMEIPQKFKNVSAFDPATPLLGIYPKGTQNTNSKEHKHPYVHCSVIYNLQDTEAAHVPRPLTGQVFIAFLGTLH